jgi:hypothetical protein
MSVLAYAGYRSEVSRKSDHESASTTYNKGEGPASGWDGFVETELLTVQAETMAYEQPRALGGVRDAQIQERAQLGLLMHFV